jgi:hypothetical protein
MTYYSYVKNEELERLRREQSTRIISIKRLEQYDKGYIPEDIIDTNTNNDFRNNKNLINQKIREMAYELFENDIEDAEEFIVLFNRVFTYENFIPVYNDILKRYKGLKVQPSIIIDTAEKLINNLENTGSTSLIKNKDDVEEIRNTLYDLKLFIETENQYIVSNYTNKSDEIEEKINSLVELFDVKVDKSYEERINNIIQSFTNYDLHIDDIHDALEDDKFFEALRGNNKKKVVSLFKTILSRESFETDEIFVTTVLNTLVEIQQHSISTLKNKFKKSSKSSK